MPTNFTKTAALLLILTLIFVAMGSVIGGRQGMVIAFLMAVAMNAYTFWRSDKLVLAMYKAQEVSPSQAPQLHAIIQELAGRAGLPMPRVFVMPNPQPNAFAVGRDPQNAAVCASTGLLEMLSPKEIAGVMAHEMSHVKNHDTLTMTIAATIGGAISMLAQWLQFSFLFGGQRRNGNWLTTLVVMLAAPFAASVVQMAISRSREYQADQLGARLCGDPRWLASALAKIQERVKGVPNATAEAIPATAHLFIVNPLTGRGFDSFFSTHPSTENRIAQLERLAQDMAREGTLHGIASAEDGAGRSFPTAANDDRGPWGAPRGPWG